MPKLPPRLCQESAPRDRDSKKLFKPQKSSWNQFENRLGFFSSQREISLPSSKKKLKGFSQCERLLDIGCSNGSFLYAARKNGWDACGLELELNSYKIAQKYGLAVYNTTLQEKSFPDDYFSVVTMWGVLEHLFHPRVILHEIRRIFKPGGVLGISIPNIRSIGWACLHENWPYIIPISHLNLFNTKGLKTTMSDCGLMTKHIETVNIQPHTVKILIGRLKGKKSVETVNTVAKMANTVTERQLTVLFTLRHLINIPLKIFGIGEDIYGYFVK